MNASQDVAAVLGFISTSHAIYTLVLHEYDFSHDKHLISQAN
jgi:hypothetical protein